jgi:ABC-type polysaccharide/polyol phosphate transport system ATPase subunit
MSLPVVECRGVTKRFYLYEHRTSTLQEVFVRSVLRRPIHVRHAQFQLRDFDLDVQAGESVAIVGSNGSGKSTALRLIAGIYPPTEGTVTCRGRVVAVIELGAAFHTELTGAENVRLYAAALGLSRAEIDERYQQMVDFSEVGDFIDTPTKYYSSGMRARLAFSVAVLANPDVLLLDEVLAVGDERFKHRCLDRLRQFQAGGGSIVFVSHDSKAVRAACTRAVWLDKGTVRLAGEVGGVMDAYHEAQPKPKPA